MYLWPQQFISLAHLHPSFGVMVNPQKPDLPVGVVEGRWWALDNGAYTGFDAEAFLAKCEQLQPWRGRCLFIVAPDVVGDAVATLALYREWAHTVKRFGPVAFVAQDGQEQLELPEFDWLFVGGTTEWKMGPGAKVCIRRAKVMGKPVHVGRVNSIKRFRYFQRLEADSADGTFPIYEPDTAVRRLTQCVAQPLLHGCVPDGHRRRQPGDGVAGAVGDADQRLPVHRLGHHEP